MASRGYFIPVNTVRPPEGRIYLQLLFLVFIKHVLLYSSLITLDVAVDEQRLNPILSDTQPFVLSLRPSCDRPYDN
jgi:hypothetical protein